ncbi:MAG: ATP synthase F1 subunit epsilon [Candidatus Cyclobacteriaceae bacterium M3_2C_046]
MYMQIVTPDKKVFEGNVDSATFPGTKGSFQVLRDHAPLISSLSEGSIKYIDEEGENFVAISGGVVEVLNNNISVLAESII